MAIKSLPPDVQQRFDALVGCIEAHTLLEKYKSKVLGLPWDHLLKKVWFDEINRLQLRLESAFCQKRTDEPTEIEIDNTLKQLNRVLEPREYTNPAHWTYVLSKEGERKLDELKQRHDNSMLPMQTKHDEIQHVRDRYSSWVYNGPKID